MRIPISGDEGSLTPYTFRSAYPFLALVYDTLLWRDARGMAQPWLARSVETSGDGLEINIRLADGARWHDGAPVTAEDVAFTFGFVADHPHPRFTPQLEAVEAVEAHGPSTVRIRLRHPSAGFAENSLADLPMIPAHLWRKLPPGLSAPEGLAIGSGPYRLVGYKPGEGYLFQANQGYFKGPPSVETIEVPIVADADDALRALERRRVDMLPFPLSPQATERVDRWGITFARGASYGGAALVFNLRSPPFERLEVRRALAKALDITRLVRSTGGVPAINGYLHPSSPWAPRSPLHVLDPELAARELQHLGLGAARLLVSRDDPPKLQGARQVEIALERVGVDVELKLVSSQELSAALGEQGGAPAFELAIDDIPPAVSYDPSVLGTLFGSQEAAVPTNHSGYKNSAFDDAVARISTTTSASNRQLAVNEALGLLSIDVPALPLFFEEAVFAYRPAIYSKWVFVSGSGIMDKLSFLGPVRAAEADSGLAGPPDTSRVPRLGLFSVFGFAIAALGAIATVFRSRRRS